MPYGLLGEEVGVLVPKRCDEEASAVSAHRATEILKVIDERWQSGNPFSASPQSERYVVPMMVQRFGLSKKAAKLLLSDWLANASSSSAIDTSIGLGLRQRRRPKLSLPGKASEGDVIALLPIDLGLANAGDRRAGKHAFRLEHRRPQRLDQPANLIKGEHPHLAAMGF